MKSYPWLPKWIILVLVMSLLNTCNFPALTPPPPNFPPPQPAIWATVPNYADFIALQQLPKVNLKVTDGVEASQDEINHFVTITNPGTSISFIVHLMITKGANGEGLLPVLWEDNYSKLLPGESRDIRAKYYIDGLGYTSPTVKVDTWNNR
jgi:exo-1,4-beta-D-glucosaminidase